MEPAKNTSINKYTIELVMEKQLSYKSIYALCLVEWETLKSYIKTHLKTEFIRPSKSPTGVSILFNKNLDSSLCLCVDYWGLNNLTIKNHHLISLISKFLDWLGWAKRFT